jgi:hypothetical protein
MECERVKQSYHYHSRIFFLLDVDEPETEEIEDARNSRYQLALVGYRWTRLVWVCVMYFCTCISHDIWVLAMRRAKEARTLAKNRQW